MITASLRSVSRMARSLTAAAVLLGSAAAAGCSTSSDTEAAPISDRVVEVVEYGEGETTVVFESGFGDDLAPWEKVAGAVATRARTFAYSRPGYGQSEPSPEPRDAGQIVEDLRGLLASRGVAPPYVLVGHSFGGAYMELFAKQHPEEVLGVVLVDPRHRDFTTACEEAGLEGCGIPDSVVETLPQVEIDEYKAFAHASEEIHAAGGFGPYPVRVLTATLHGFEPEVEALWESMHGSLADEAKNGEQKLFVGAGHYLHLQRADEVAEVILSLVPPPEG